jgi:hypothetical protein
MAIVLRKNKVNRMAIVAQAGSLLFRRLAVGTAQFKPTARQ